MAAAPSATAGTATTALGSVSTSATSGLPETSGPALTPEPLSALPGVDNADASTVWFYLEADSGSERAGYVPADARAGLLLFASSHELGAARIPEVPPAEAGVITSTADGAGDASGTGNAGLGLYDGVGVIELGFGGPDVDLAYLVARSDAPYGAGSCDWDWRERGWESVEGVEVAPGVDGCVVTGEFYQRLVWARDGVAYAIEQIGDWVPVERLIELANAPSVAIADL